MATEAPLGGIIRTGAKNGASRQRPASGEVSRAVAAYATDQSRLARWSCVSAQLQPQAAKGQAQLLVEQLEVARSRRPVCSLA
jgi:hypothetical protein